MLIRWPAVLLLCLAVVQCGSQTPTAPTSPSSSLEPAPSATPFPVQAPMLPGDPTPSSPQTGGAEIFVGAGDIAACDVNSENTARLLDSIGGTVFTTGDNAYPQATEAQFRQCYDPTWGRHRSRTRPAPGNHEYNQKNAAPYFAYFGASAGPAGLGYYSYEVGPWLVLSLNSNTNIPAQVTFLKNILARSKHRCTIAYWHHPRYSSGEAEKVAAVRELWDVLYDGGAEVVLSSHDHLYERFAPQDKEGRVDLQRGMRQFVVGTGGAPQHVWKNKAANSEALFGGFGVLKLTLSANSYEWQFIPVSGQGDSGSGQCH
jgi:acid phosphatase type 7